ncbi:hypothetical protein SAMN04488120_10735 [Fontimonas thermophila]|uniref:DUF456 domain-containing protein n=1 Tax=Fontimonas thermophila TaxID=1076937 RepID=A0A1I2JE82_9GAMM|nr:DUF456 family protein [Fontimonas thermophila]SFF52864.1 hypothetical protein SAMN04488120_10735 [Fontimonas thermophila]
MDPLAVTLLWLAVVGLVIVGLAGTVVPALPGLPVVFAGLWLGAWIDDYARVGVPTLVLLAVLVVLGMAVDFLASVLGAQRVGASRQAIAGAVLGSIAGMFFGLPGIVLGPFVGAVAGELWARSGATRAAHVGLATWLGLLLGAVAKLALALVMLGIFTFAYLF